MSGEPAGRQWPLHLFAVMCMGTAAVFCATAVLTTLDALDARRSAADATELRRAVTVLHHLDTGSSDQDLGRTVEAVSTINADPGPALAALPPQLRTDATSALTKVRDHGASFLRASEPVSNINETAESLELLLALAAQEAARDANAAEAQSSFAAALALFSLACLGVTVLAIRTQRSREAIQQAGMLEAGARFEVLLDASPDTSLIVHDDEQVIWASQSIDALFGQNVGQTLRDLTERVTPDQQDAFREHVLTSTTADAVADFTLLPLSTAASGAEIQVRVNDLRDDPLVSGRLVTVRDITNEVRLRRRLEHQALVDTLTGLPNRRAAVRAMNTTTGNRALLMLDLDGFKQTNDSLGHAAGDQLLAVVANRFSAVVGERHELFRLGGDEFAVLTDTDDCTAVEGLADQLIACLDTPVRLDDSYETLGTSVGIAFESARTSPNQLLLQADIALYEAKSRDGGCHVSFEPSMETRNESQRNLSRALSDMRMNDELRLVYQPIVDARTGQIRSVEALLRWTSPSIGVVRPDEFIHLAESSGRINQIGLWVLETACADLATWRRAGLAEHVTLSVNVSPRQFEQPDFESNVLSTIHANDLRPTDIVIEVTESGLVAHDEKIVERLGTLRLAGCRVAIDDFGSGFSNLGQLLGMPLDIIKVDRSLLERLSGMREAAGGSVQQPCEVMAAIVSIGEAIGAPIVAEGVETGQQQMSLRDSGVPLLQGYHFSRPLEVDAMTEMLVGSDDTAVRLESVHPA